MCDCVWLFLTEYDYVFAKNFCLFAKNLFLQLLQTTSCKVDEIIWWNYLLSVTILHRKYNMPSKSFEGNQLKMFCEFFFATVYAGP